MAYVLMRKAQQATLVGDSASTIALSRSAASQNGIARRVRAAALQQQAHGHARDLDEIASLTALDHAGDLVSGGAGPTLPFDLASYCTPHSVQAQRGACLLALRRPRQALLAFDAALAAWPQEYRRERGLHMARKAIAVVAAGEPESAATTALEALNVVRATGSARIISELTVADTLLGQIETRADQVQEFRAQVRPLLPATSPS
ncbi:hypothetical protein [Allokutzneria multivorans]|uniref:hypothetical protein n=1 Tax=Allokutzneria multivorans TaxID=1142134 RepID=UPI0031E960CB